MNSKIAIQVRASQLKNIKLFLTAIQNEYAYVPPVKNWRWWKSLYAKKGGYVYEIAEKHFKVKMSPTDVIVGSPSKYFFVRFEKNKYNVYSLPYIELNGKQKSYIYFNADEDAIDFYNQLLDVKGIKMINLPESIFKYKEY